jgi:hypothetical protein
MMLAGDDTSDIALQAMSTVCGPLIVTFVARLRWAPCG